MTDDEYIEMCAEKARKEAREIIEKHLEPFDMVKDEFYPNNNTVEEFNKILLSMGDTEGLGEDRIAMFEEDEDE